MIDFSTVLPAYRGLVGFQAEKDITLAPALLLSSSQKYINEKPIDLQGIDRALALKPDLTKYQTVSDYLSAIYDNCYEYALLDFINWSIIKLQMIEKRKYTLGIIDYAEKIALTTNFLGFLIYPKQNERISITRIAMNVSKAQSIRFFLYDFETNEEIDIFDEDLEIGMNYFSFSINVSAPAYIGVYRKNQTSPQVWQLDDDNEIYYYNYEENQRVYPIVANIPTSQELQTITQTPFIVNFNCEKNYTQFLVENKELFVEIIQKKFQLKILNDIQYTFEFNTITESNRENYRQAILMIQNELYGYDFEQDNIKGHQEGLYERILKRCQSIEPTLFPELEKIQL